MQKNKDPFPILRAILSLMLMAFLAAMVAAVAAVYYFTADLPDYSQLEEYAPPVVTRIYSSDGKILEEYARERRIFVPIKAIPKQVVQAFLAAEDRNFYSHAGIDLSSIARAAIQNILNIGQKKSMIGGSTITQQVVKNFLLTNERTFSRKLKEAILAYRLTSIYSKDQILELYLNEIYLGGRAYGVAAAALHYFNKSLDELSLEEAALLAALPKAPSAFDPRRNYGRAESRRNWVLDGMVEVGVITKEQATSAKKMPIILKNRSEDERTEAAFFAEEIRRELVKKYSAKQVYEGGLTVFGTIVPEYQAIAMKALRAGLEEYDRRHGWRGPIANINGVENWIDGLKKMEAADELPDVGWQLATILKIEAKEVEIGLSDGKRNKLLLEDIKWARKWLPEQFVGEPITQMSDVFKRGDVVWVSAKEKDKGYNLKQIPDVGGAIVVQDVHTGKVLAMQGGYAFEKSQFNRATQALRQPGSAFKPFAYMAALERGYTPATLVNDAPIELYWGSGENIQTWSPKNYSGDFLGPTTLRRGLELSRNLMTIRMALDIGIGRVTEIAKRFGINENPKRNFSTVLGATETTLLRITNAYAMIVNGGIRVHPTFIDRIQDRTGTILYRSDIRTCEGCNFTENAPSINRVPPKLPEVGERIADPVTSYLMVNMLEGVVKRGTAAKAASLGLPLGGKTGTTNNNLDAWFVGFTPDTVIGVYVGFDTPRSLGEKETGSSVALPIFMNYVKEATKDKTTPPFRVPSGIRMAQIDYFTGYLPSQNTSTKDKIFEAFPAEKVPDRVVDFDDLINPNTAPTMMQAPVPLSDGEDTPTRRIEEAPATLGTGGFY